MHTIKRLEQALRIWEDGCRVGSLSITASRELGVAAPPAAVQNADVFRRAPTLRTALRTMRENPFVPTNFQVPMEFAGVLAMYPDALAAWTLNSRRVFELDRTLEQLLLATTLEDVTWREVPFPFSSFALTLPVPVEDAEGSRYDCILFSSVITPDLGEVRALHLFSDRLDQIPLLDRAKVQRDVERHRWDRIQREARQLGAALNRLNPISVCMVGDSGAEQPVTRSMVAQVLDVANLTEVPDGSRVVNRCAELWDLAARLVVGLSFYLTTVEGQERGAQSDWVPSPRTIDPNAITQRCPDLLRAYYQHAVSRGSRGARRYRSRRIPDERALPSRALAASPGRRR